MFMSQLAGRKEQSAEQGVADPDLANVSWQQGAVILVASSPASAKIVFPIAGAFAAGCMNEPCAAEATVAENTSTMSAQSHFIMAGS